MNCSFIDIDILTSKIFFSIKFCSNYFLIIFKMTGPHKTIIRGVNRSPVVVNSYNEQKAWASHYLQKDDNQRQNNKPRNNDNPSDADSRGSSEDTGYHTIHIGDENEGTQVTSSFNGGGRRQGSGRVIRVNGAKVTRGGSARSSLRHKRNKLTSAQENFDRLIRKLGISRGNLYTLSLINVINNYFSHLK